MNKSMIKDGPIEQAQAAATNLLDGKFEMPKMPKMPKMPFGDK